MRIISSEVNSPPGIFYVYHLPSRRCAYRPSVAGAALLLRLQQWCSGTAAAGPAA
jgi:hypothetical protein